ncbi:MAG TPA: alpha/beta fold hydrolase [Burkholderiales bacterium]|jgi:aminoacrylate hydrolase|nr:alpha/beta fold hydrolase [Burkholderiales bacterium]
MPKVSVAGGEIHYEEAGHGEPLLFVSGLSGVGRYWQPQVPLFSSRFRVITYDHRGTGNSDKLQREFSVDQMAAELVELMDALKIERAHVVGLSTGGAIGQTLAIEQPQRIERLVMCSTWTHCDPWFRRLFEARRLMYQQCGPELHAMFHPLWLFSPDYVNEHDAEIDEERKRAVSTAPPVEVSVGRIDALLKFDRRAGLSRIKTPTLIIASDNDYITPAYYARALAEAIPGSKLEVLKGGGHSVSKTRPEMFNKLVMDFLTAA